MRIFGFCVTIITPTVVEIYGAQYRTVGMIRFGQGRISRNLYYIHIYITYRSKHFMLWLKLTEQNIYIYLFTFIFIVKANHLYIFMPNFHIIFPTLNFQLRNYKCQRLWEDISVGGRSTLWFETQINNEIFRYWSPCNIELFPENEGHLMLVSKLALIN